MSRPADTAGGAVVGGVDVDRVAAAVSACPHVVRLGGTGGPGTYLPGRRVPGVVVRQPAGATTAGMEIHVVARYGPTMDEVAGEVRAALAELYSGVAVDVIVDDIEVGDIELDPVDPPLPAE